MAWFDVPKKKFIVLSATVVHNIFSPYFAFNLCDRQPVIGGHGFELEGGGGSLEDRGEFGRAHA